MCNVVFDSETFAKADEKVEESAGITPKMGPAVRPIPASFSQDISPGFAEQVKLQRNPIKITANPIISAKKGPQSKPTNLPEKKHFHRKCLFPRQAARRLASNLALIDSVIGAAEKNADRQSLLSEFNDASVRSVSE